MSNTYCVVETTNSHQLYKTQTRPSLHPVWNESYQVLLELGRVVARWKNEV